MKEVERMDGQTDRPTARSRSPLLARRSFPLPTTYVYVPPPLSHACAQTEYEDFASQSTYAYVRLAPRANERASEPAVQN